MATESRLEDGGARRQPSRLPALPAQSSVRVIRASAWRDVARLEDEAAVLKTSGAIGARSDW